jgi:hypothetical protein
MFVFDEATPGDDEEVPNTLPMLFELNPVPSPAVDRPETVPMLFADIAAPRPAVVVPATDLASAPLTARPMLRAMMINTVNANRILPLTIL